MLILVRAQHSMCKCPESHRVFERQRGGTGASMGTISTVQAREVAHPLFFGKPSISLKLP